MDEYQVEVVIENKPLAKDPEGESILRDLVGRGGYQGVRSVRSGKYLRFAVGAEGPEEAKAKVYKLCNDLRIYNPVVHTCSVKTKGDD